MCDFCTKKQYDPFDKRMEYVQDILNRNTPDLITLQELRTTTQVGQLFKNLPQYRTIFYKFFLGSYPDATLAYNTTRFKKLEQGSFWLGPSSGFTLGWEISLPRIVIWAKFKDKLTNKEFMLMSSHFDNRVENLNQSGIKVREFLKNKNIPIIFSADTNLPRSYQGYQNLTGGKFINSYDLKLDYSVNSNFEYKARDLCYTTKGKTFPECSVEHVLLSKDHKWNVIKWQLDLFKYGQNQSFPSDHRAVVVTFSL